MNFRHISLVIAESVDAWRIIPRTILVLYSTLVFHLYIWYRSIPTYVQEQCDPVVLQTLVELGKTIEETKSLACSVVDIVGGPTAAQSAFVTTIIGLSTGIFGLYVATGRRWDRNDYSNNNGGFPYPHLPPPTYNDPRYGHNPNPHDTSYGPPPPGPPNSYGPSNNNSYGPSYNPPSRGPWGQDQNASDESPPIK